MNDPPAQPGPAPAVNPSAPTAARAPWPMRLLGLRRRTGGWLPFGFTLWGKILVLILGVTGGTLAFAEYSMQPDFCRSCHIMEPYYQAWHQSTHKNVPCTDCHFEPGIEKTIYGKWQASSQAVKWATGTYGSKPHAEIRDSSCMRSGCHEQRLLEGKVTWDAPSVRGGHVTIHFDHTPHLQDERRGKQLRCVSCHSQIVQGQHIAVTLETCFLCHFKGFEHGRNEQTLGGCKACHGVPKETVRLATGDFDHAQYADRGVPCQSCHADVVKGDGAVPRQVCWTCHNQPDQIARYGETARVHTEHVTEHKVDCSSCHIKIEHNLSPMPSRPGITMQVATPGAAHSAEAPAGGPATRPSGAVSVGSAAPHAGALGLDACAQCHERTHGGPAELYRGVGGRGVPDMPSPMSRARVSCIACHREQAVPSAEARFAGQTFRADQAACDTCHGSKYVGLLDAWKAVLASHLDRADAALLAGRNAEADPNARLKPEDLLAVRRLLDDAEYNVRYVRIARGVHNVNYATALLNAAVESADKARALAGGPGPTTRPGGASP